MGHHLKSSQMAATTSDRFQIVQTNAGLGDRQWIRRWLGRTACDMRLENCYGCNRKIYVISPASDHRSSRDSSMIVLLKETEKRFPSLIKIHWFGEQGFTNERIFNTRCIPTKLALNGRPEEAIALCTLLPGKT